jgi:hypothetical protein
VREEGRNVDRAHVGASLANEWAFSPAKEEEGIWWALGCPFLEVTAFSCMGRHVSRLIPITERLRIETNFHSSF